MKKPLIVASLFLAVLLFACQVPVDNAADSKDTQDTAGLAKVLIPLPKTSTVRAVGLEGAKAYTDFFEVSFKDKSTGAVFSANAAIEEEYIEAVIPPGNYDVLLYAGDKDYYANYNPLLLASGYAQDVAITLEETNTLNLTLATFDVDVTAPAKVMVGKSFAVGFTINTNNPLIGRFDKATLPDRGSYLRYKLNNGNIEDIRINVDDFVKEESIYTYSHTLTAPAAAGNAVAEFYGYMEMFSSSSVWLYIPIAHPDLSEPYKKSITFVEGAGVNVNITWPE